jgi:fatty-acyl-CoA synthase
VPKAYVSLRPDRTLGVDELIAYCRTRLAGYKVPRQYQFGPLPKTSTGKILKVQLREEAWKGCERRIN